MQHTRACNARARVYACPRAGARVRTRLILQGPGEKAEVLHQLGRLRIRECVCVSAAARGVVREPAQIGCPQGRWQRRPRCCHRQETPPAAETGGPQECCRSASPSAGVLKKGLPPAHRGGHCRRRGGAAETGGPESRRRPSQPSAASPWPGRRSRRLWQSARTAQRARRARAPARRCTRARSRPCLLPPPATRLLPCCRFPRWRIGDAELEKL